MCQFIIAYLLSSTREISRCPALSTQTQVISLSCKSNDIRYVPTGHLVALLLVMASSGKSLTVPVFERPWFYMAMTSKFNCPDTGNLDTGGWKVLPLSEIKETY